jgi:uncharacterized protein
MLDQSEILKFLSENISELKTGYNVSKIGIFGSFARNEQTENSDIDIIFEFETGTTGIFEKKIKLQEYLHKSFNRDIDLCREKYIKPYVKNYLSREAIYV